MTALTLGRAVCAGCCARGPDEGGDHGQHPEGQLHHAHPEGPAAEHPEDGPCGAGHGHDPWLQQCHDAKGAPCSLTAIIAPCLLSARTLTSAPACCILFLPPYGDMALGFRC